MKRIWALFVQDLLLAYRNGHVLITALLLAIALAAITFLPRELAMHAELFLDASAEGLVAARLRAEGLPENMIFTDRAAFDEALARSPMKVGVIFTGDLQDPRFELITRSAVADENLRLLEAALDGMIAGMRGERVGPAVTVETLRPQAGGIPFNLRIVPVLLIFEVVLLGFFIAAVLVFQEKSEGTLRAYRVTPGGTLSYLASKTLLFVVLSLAYGLIPLLYAFGLRVNYLPLVLILVLSSSLMTLLSLAVASFYRNLTEWFFVGVAILLINSLPVVSYSLPVFAPRWLTLLPSYPAVFAVRDVLFAGAGLAQVGPTLAYLLASNLAALGLAYLAVRTQLMKGRRA